MKRSRKGQYNKPARQRSSNLTKVSSSNSRKQGTRLNDLQYFRQPLPHARKKMTCLRIFPSENASPTSKSRLSPASKRRRKKKSGNPPTKLDINQPSIEMAVITYTDSQASLQLLQARRTRETQVSELEFPDTFSSPRRDVSSFTQTEKPREKEASTSPVPLLQEEVEEEDDQRQRSSPLENKSRRQSSAWLKRIFADFFQLLLPASNKRVDAEPKPLRRDSHQRSAGLASLFRSRTDEEAAVTQRILIKGDESLRAAYMNNVALKARSAENGGLHAQMSCGPLKSF